MLSHKEKVLSLLRRKLRAHALHGRASGLIPLEFFGEDALINGIDLNWNVVKEQGIRLTRLLGCGGLGCAFETLDKDWIAKFTTDYSEVKLFETIEKLRADGFILDGFVAIKDIIHLDQVSDDEDYEDTGEPDDYLDLIIKENVTPIEKLGLSDADIEATREAIQYLLWECDALGALAAWRLRVRLAGKRATRGRRTARERRTYYKRRISHLDFDTDPLAESLRTLSSEGIDVYDIKISNIGLTKDRRIVIFDAEQG